jgi:hypothetical protein
LEEGEKVKGVDRAGHGFEYTLASPVDAAGKLSDGKVFSNIQDLKVLLQANPRQLARNLLQQLSVYAAGTPVRFSDRAEIESILDACAANGFRVRDLMQGLIQSRLFLGTPCTP